MRQPKWSDVLVEAMSFEGRDNFRGDESPDNIAGEYFGKYLLLGEIATGGMGSLHLALQRGPQDFARVVALKRMLPHYAAIPECVEMFFTEARILARSAHPNTVSVYDFGNYEGRYFIAMEYLPGEDLRAIHTRLAQLGKQAPVLELTSVFEACARGLHGSHSLRGAGGEPLGLVHRDVSPSNIIVTYHGATKLVDFGVAKTRENGVHTAVGTFKGKLSHSAPEQISSGPIDARTDVFCLGISLWELLTGQQLFWGASEAAIIDRVRSAPILPPSRVRSDVPPVIDAIVSKALARDPEHRFPNADELARALAEALAECGGPVAPKEIADWMRDLWGADRADLKVAISQGRNLSTLVPRLIACSSGSTTGAPPASGALPKPRTAWSVPPARAESQRTPLPRLAPSDTRGARPSQIPPLVVEPEPNLEDVDLAAPVPLPIDLPAMPLATTPLDGSFEARTDVRFAGSTIPPSLPLPKRRLATAFAAGIISVAGALSAWTLWPSGQVSDAPSNSWAQIAVESDPPGAAIFVEGAPLGRVTPATIDIPRGSSVDVRLEKSGFKPAIHAVSAGAGAPGRIHERLEPSEVSVSFSALPPKTFLYIDGVLAGRTSQITLPLGRHRVRVETANDLVLEREIEVTAETSFFDLAARERSSH